MSETIVLTVTGMKCGGCETNISDKLKTLDGVLSVSASHKDNKVEVGYDPAKIEVEEIEDAVIDAGFSVE
ncbi:MULTISPECIES: heavy-metal-associated domain-containing protein [Methylotuvimicrobium]|uniref:Heavy metal transport/detoxification protein n=2 Tax=Methylotuvimicrobium TaxID=2822410 RepID=G4T041_META2|nr:MULTISPECIES: heavy-metal-associated domain-containing protein [Methylotuvimicrobium]QCW82512.1 copper chaperone [Methylotuvimicrobium buryatense]CCE23331.1 Heavy metal transport/detoxification protein [Methylotuvimicrobium alcaliphilum 20Z]